MLLELLATNGSLLIYVVCSNVFTLCPISGAIGTFGMPLFDQDTCVIDVVVQSDSN